MKPGILVATLVLSAAFVPVSAQKPPVRIKLAEDELVTGDRERVTIRTEANGYLVVLRMTAEGGIRVLFPLDPADDASVRGGRDFEVRSRGGREAFFVTEKNGAGMVLAARTDEPFDFTRFSDGRHWIADSLAVNAAATDAESALLAVVDRMTDKHYDYDAVEYTVSANPPRRTYARSPFFFGGWYDPWYDPWYRRRSYVPFYYGGGFGFGATIVIPRRSVIVRPPRGHRH